jgi:hypothetical protein
MKFLLLCHYIPINTHTTGKSVDTVLHQLAVRVGKALNQQKTGQRVFLDTESAFSNTSCDSMCAAIFKHGVDYTIVR